MYEALEARLHDAFWNAEEGPGELELLQSFHRHHPGRALELGCGSGRLLLPLLASGVEIEGIDLSPDMLDLCREQAKAQRLDPVLHLGDIEAPGLKGPYAALSLPAFTFQLVKDPARLLTSCYKLLQPHGGLYLTAFVPHSELEGEAPEGEWYRDRDLVLPDQNQARVDTRHTIDHEHRLLVRDHRYTLCAPDGLTLETHECTEQIHWIHPDELDNLLREYMFEVQQTIVNFDPDDDTPPEEATVYTFLAQRAEIIV